MRHVVACVGLFFALLLPAAAAPDAALTQQLLAVYSAWGKAIIAGNLDAALAQRDANTAKGLRADTASPGNRASFLSIAKDMHPDRVEVHETILAPDGMHATLKVTAFKTIPMDVPPGGPKPGSVVDIPARLLFLREAGAWKFVDQQFGPEQQQAAMPLKPCLSEAWEGETAFDDARHVSAGGPIIRVDFAADHTMIVFRVVDEANCAFLPPRAVLDKGGLNTAMLVPDAMVELAGWPHRSDPTRLWVTELDVHPAK